MTTIWVSFFFFFFFASIYVAPCKTVMPYILSRPYKLSQHWPLTSAACNSALLWSSFQPTSFQWERSCHSSVLGLQIKNRLKCLSSTKTKRPFFFKQNYPELRKLWSLEVGKSTLRATVDVFIGWPNNFGVRTACALAFSRSDPHSLEDTSKCKLMFTVIWPYV